MSSTLLLDLSTWDLLPDAYGNIAMATEPYSQAQDVASYCKVFRGEAWLDTTRGIPYWQDILGHRPPLSLLKQYYITTALTVPGIVEAACFIDSVTNRVVSGQIQSTNTAGVLNVSRF